MSLLSSQEQYSSLPKVTNHEIKKQHELTWQGVGQVYEAPLDAARF